MRGDLENADYFVFVSYHFISTVNSHFALLLYRFVGFVLAGASATTALLLSSTVEGCYVNFI